MIKVKLNNDGNYIKEITITGHANYDIYGKDIVCASVSATVLTTINGIMAIDDSIILVSFLKDKVNINVKRNDNISQILLNNMISCLKEIEKEYPKNMKIYD